MSPESHARVGLAVGAGGPTGGPFIDAVMSVVNERTGWEPHFADTIVGTSAGAFVASWLPRQVETPDEGIIAKLRALENGSDWSRRPGDRVASTFRLVAARIIARFAPKTRQRAEYRVPSGPFHFGANVVTVSKRGKRAVHRLHDASDAAAAVRASAAIPFLNGPYPVDGQLHVDGAVFSPTNSDLLNPQTHDLIIVVAPMIPSSGGSISARLHRAQLRVELDRAVSAGLPVVVVAPSAAEHARRRDLAYFVRAGIRAGHAL